MTIEIKDLHYRKIAKLLANEKEIICVTPAAHGAVAAVAITLLQVGKDVRAKVIKGYK
jgi:hypothetical protein